MVSARLEMSPKRKPLAEAHASFHKGLKEVSGNEFEINVVYGKIQMKLLWKCYSCKIHSLWRRSCRTRFESQIRRCSVDLYRTEFGVALFEAHCEIELM